jgi:NAD(P) transhydrogenase
LALSNNHSVSLTHYFLFAGVLKSDPLLLPGRNLLNGSMMATNVGAMGYFMYSNDPTIGLACLGTTTALSSIMGVTLTAAIGGIC